MQKIHGTRAENSVTLSEQTGFMRESLDVSLSDHKIAEMVSELNKGDVPSEEADVDAALSLQAALEADDDVDAVVTAINTHAAHATPEPLGRAREKRNELKTQKKKVRRLNEGSGSGDAEEARVEELMQLLVEENRIRQLHNAIGKAEQRAGVSQELDNEVEVAKQRLLSHRTQTRYLSTQGLSVVEDLRLNII